MRVISEAHASSAATAVSAGIRQVLKIHQGSQETNNNICCGRTHLWLAQCGVSLNAVLPSNWVWCPGLLYRPVPYGSLGRLLCDKVIWGTGIYWCINRCSLDDVFSRSDCMSSGLIEPRVICETCVSERYKCFICCSAFQCVCCCCLRVADSVELTDPH